MSENTEANVNTGFGVTREEVEQSLEKAIQEKVQLTRTIDSLDGSIQTMEYILYGPERSQDDLAEEDMDKKEEEVFFLQNDEETLS